MTVGAAAKAEGGAGDGEGTTAAGPRGASWATRPPPNARTTRGPSGRLAEEAVVEEAAGESPAAADPAGKTEGAWGDDDKAIEPAGGGSGAASWDAEVAGAKRGPNDVEAVEADGERWLRNYKG